MKRSVTLILFAVACFVSVPRLVLAQSLSPVMPPGHGAAPVASAPPKAQTFDVLALRATQEGNLSKNLGEELRPVREILEMLPYDTYGTLSQVEREAPFGEETSIPINERYSFHVLPLEQHESGEIEVMARIAMREADETLDALRAQGKAAPGKALVFRGMPLDDGELVVLVRLKQEDGEDSDNSQSSENPPEDQEGEEQESEGEQQDSESEAQQNDEQETPEESEAGEEPKDLKNLEAILQSLEDLDRREQEEARNQREAIRLQGDWW